MLPSKEPKVGLLQLGFFEFCHELAAAPSPDEPPVVVGGTCELLPLGIARTRPVDIERDKGGELLGEARPTATRF